jgi:hypothetical protein
LHLPPIEQVFYLRPYLVKPGDRRFKATTGPKLLSPEARGPLMWFTWTSECFSRTVRSYRLNLPSVPFAQIAPGQL